MPLIEGIHHINLTVPRGTLAQANDFYGLTLGLTPRQVPELQRGSLAWQVTSSCQQHRLLLLSTYRLNTKPAQAVKLTAQAYSPANLAMTGSTLVAPASKSTSPSARAGQNLLGILASRSVRRKRCSSFGALCGNIIRRGMRQLPWKLMSPARQILAPPEENIPSGSLPGTSLGIDWNSRSELEVRENQSRGGQCS